MKNAFKLSSLLFVGLILFQVSCSDDAEPTPDPLPDPTGSWVLQKATLVTPDPLLVKNYTTDGQNFVDLSVPAGDFQTTTLLVGGALAGAACENPANYGGFYLELVSDGTLDFHCPAEDFVEEQGSWVVLETAGSYSITLNVVAAGTTLPITFKNFVLAADGSNFTGQASGYPMVKDLSMDLSADNLQFLTVDMVFVAKP